MLVIVDRAWQQERLLNPHVWVLMDRLSKRFRNMAEKCHSFEMGKYFDSVEID